jgi:tetratricopeptide (TPR) repeat protein
MLRIGVAVALAFSVCAAPASGEAAERAKSTKGKTTKTKTTKGTPDATQGDSAKDAKDAKDAKGAKKKTAPIDQKIGAKLNKAIELLNADKYEEAKAVLESINMARLSPYELARVESILAAIAQGQEHPSEARDHLLKAIESGGLNDQEVLSTRFQVAQLFLAEEKWKEGVAALKAWFASGATPNSNAYYLLAVAYYQMKEYALALEPAQKAIDLSDKPQEGWLQLLLALRLEREEYDLAVPILHKLLKASPGKKNYWLQLSNIYGMAEKYAEALVPMQMAYAAGLLTEASEYRRLADLALHQNIPYRAAVVLSKAIEDKKIPPEFKDWEKLGNCWIASRQYDKAIAPLTKAAALAENGDSYVRLAEIEVQLEDWQKAVDALVHALDKGNLKSESEAHILMGVVLLNQKKLKEARARFQRAIEDPKKRAEAEGWIRYIDAQLRG